MLLLLTLRWGPSVALGQTWPMFHHDRGHSGVSQFDTSSDTGSTEWVFPTGDVVESSPALGKDGTIYVGSEDDDLYAVKPNGHRKWKFTTGNFVQSSPAVGADGTIYVGSGDGNLYAVKPTGTIKWQFPTGSFLGSSPAVGADGTIYIGSNDGNLYAVH